MEDGAWLFVPCQKGSTMLAIKTNILRSKENAASLHNLQMLLQICRIK